MSATTNCLNGSLLTLNTFVSVMYCYLANECQIKNSESESRDPPARALSVAAFFSNRTSCS